MSEQKKKTNRGKSPIEQTIRMLCANAGGMCEFPGCSEYLFSDNISATEFNHSCIAHIIASSPDGPRGDEVLSHELSDNLDNLLLLCAKHHDLIDKHKEDYPTDLLHKYKERHERIIREATKLLEVPQSKVIVFTAPIHGNTPQITRRAVNVAVFPDRYIADEYPLEIKVECGMYPENEVRHWQFQFEILSRQYKERLEPFFEHNPDMSCDVFGLAPIPLLAKFGEMIGDKNSIRLHHHTRHPETWKWISSNINNTFFSGEILKKTDNVNGKVALVISISDKIDSDHATHFLPDISFLYTIDAEKYGVDAIQSEDDLSAFWHTFQDVLGEIHRKHPECKEIPVVAAVPAVAAIEMGRRRMKGVHPVLIMYNAYDNGYIDTTIKIGD